MKNGQPETSGPAGPEQERLASAFQLLSGKVNEALGAIRIDTTVADARKRQILEDKIKEIRDKALGAHVIFVAIDNEDDAYLAFETLNTRGKDLTVSDLVINHVTRLIRRHAPAVDVPREKWRAITQRLEQSQADLDINKFLLHFWLSRNEYVAEKKLFRSMRARITKTNAKQFLAELDRDSLLYRQINEPGFRKWHKNDGTIPKSMKAVLEVFRVEQPLPLFLSLIRQYDGKALKKKHAEQTMRAVECYHFAFTAIAGRSSSGGISQMYARHARDLTQAKTPEEKVKSLSELRDKLRAGLPTKDEFIAGFKTLRFSATFTKQRKLVHYVLCEMARFDSRGTAVDCDSMTIEHVAPQAGSLDEETVAHIGNLILVDDPTNNKLGAKPFTQKQAVLKNTNVPMRAPILAASKWEKTEILERADEMARKAFEKIWAL